MQPIMTITGRLGTDVEERFTRNGVPFARFRLAHTPRVLERGGWVDGETTWLTVRAYRRLGDNAKSSLRKGEPVIVTGRVHTESWVDQQGVCGEHLVLEASSLGHDLAHGESMFRRAAAKDAGQNAETTGASQQADDAQADDPQADDRAADEQVADEQTTTEPPTAEPQVTQGEHDPNLDVELQELAEQEGSLVRE